MAESSQMNVNVLPITRERVKELSKRTYRGMGDVVDWAVGLAWSAFELEQRVAITEAGRKALAAEAGAEISTEK